MVFVRYRAYDDIAQRGSLLMARHSILRFGDIAPHEGALEWQCPCCSYSLLFEPHDEMIAESAVRCHFLSQHDLKM